MKKTLVLAAVAAFSAAGVVASPGVASARISPPSVPPVPPAVQKQLDRVSTDWFNLHTGELHDRVIYTIQPVCNALGFQCS